MAFGHLSKETYEDHLENNPDEIVEHLLLQL